MAKEKIYFASDFHLGVDTHLSSLEREKRIVKWLEQIRSDAAEIYLVGDIFDYWFEYSKVVPKGFIRLIGKLAELRDQGIPIYFFTGNHDMWMFSYFEDELGIPIYRAPTQKTIQGKKFLIGHGDGLGPGDRGYKFIKKVFASKINQWLFARLHPNLGIGIMRYFSGKSRAVNKDDKLFLGPEKEWLVQYCEKKLAEEYYDYFIFGHRHLPIDYTLSNRTSRYVNIGDWTDFYSYGVLEDGELKLCFFESKEQVFGE